MEKQCECCNGTGKSRVFNVETKRYEYTDEDCECCDGTGMPKENDGERGPGIIISESEEFDGWR